MFVRIKTTPNSPKKAVQIVESVRVGATVKQKIIRHIGQALDDEELGLLKALAESILRKLETENQPCLFAPEELAASQKVLLTEEHALVHLTDLTEEQRVIDGIHDVYGALFDTFGFGDVIAHPSRHQASVRMLRDVVMARIANPQSKRASVHMLEQDFGITLDLQQVYRMMDRLDERAIAAINRIAYDQTRSLFQGKIDVVFYDATTLYFEAFEEDELRKCGFSKDLKFNQPQVLLALMVTKEGLPVGYKLFPGNTFEGHTLIPTLTEIRTQYDLDNVVFVADSGLFNQANLDELEQHGFHYIVGARIKNLPATLTKTLLDTSLYTPLCAGTQVAELAFNGRRLIVTHKEKRAAKDARDRARGIERLRKKLTTSANVKDQLSNHGYRKFLRVTGDSSLSIDEAKLAEASQWDGLHGIITHSDLSAAEALAQYHNLWQVENAFRVTKHDLKVRPIFHWKKERIQAHLAISFMAYTLVQHLTYRVRLQHQPMSVEAIRKVLLRVQTSIYRDTRKKVRYGLPNPLSPDAAKIYRIVQIKPVRTPYILHAASHQTQSTSSEM